ncbi:hypothetical protein ASG31_13815 [Chryseobacterium sp. Leaf404]|uniref:hypothetical protein n=1 Tax=unclassified Chryseobacterium TaxID=2593645 RepID=UPI0006FD1B74|nr:MULTISPECIES: hypothetical protein [unclassified Chryseobacterium]KQT16049.1 hypothetical protein ASG31_13815 [Chryseobacterium sp. Leaf404]
MKKIFIISSVFLSGLAFSQSDNRYVYEEQEDNSTEKAEGDFPSAPGAPIDDYIPVLVLAAVGIAAYYGRKKRVTE